MTRSGCTPATVFPAGNEAEVADQFRHRARGRPEDHLVGRADLQQLAAVEHQPAGRRKSLASPSSWVTRMAGMDGPPPACPPGVSVRRKARVQPVLRARSRKQRVTPRQEQPAKVPPGAPDRRIGGQAIAVSKVSIPSTEASGTNSAPEGVAARRVAQVVPHRQMGEQARVLPQATRPGAARVAQPFPGGSVRVEHATAEFDAAAGRGRTSRAMTSR